MAQSLEIANQGLIPFPLGANEHVRQRLACQQLLFAPFERPDAGDEASFGGKGGEQALGEGVDGLDPEPSPASVEHPGNERAAGPAHFRPHFLAPRAPPPANRPALPPPPTAHPPLHAPPPPPPPPPAPRPAP